ncbi:MAG: DNA methyltransferase, partial [Bradyrhizobium sp.]
MMRLIVLFYAEERKLLPEDTAFQETYAVSGVLDGLNEQQQRFGDDEILSRRFDAWPRILATFRAVHGGIDHDRVRLLAYGGGLFDPDRFPFLEGRLPGTNWRTAPSHPIRIDNQTVRHILLALQWIEAKDGARRLSFNALDVEQIGHVYERLLDHTTRVASEPMLGLTGKAGEEPEVTLAALETERAKGDAALLAYIKAQTNRSENQLRKLLEDGPSDTVGRRLAEACNNDRALQERMLPFAGVLRSDRADRPLVILAGSHYVTSGEDRRSSGAHYTPKSLTEEIVKHALDPLVFIGPAEGVEEADWKRRTPRELLRLRICDPAMGSGAFLVQACRYLAGHLVAAWAEIEATHGRPILSPFGDLDLGEIAVQPMPSDPEERQALARRAVVDHCLYGVDKNPLAVEMAKLSLWLITLQKDRPFTFLDHALRQGDSLLGIANIDELINWH